MAGSGSMGLTNLVAGSNADGNLNVFGVNNNGVIYLASESAPEVNWSTTCTPLNNVACWADERRRLEQLATPGWCAVKFVESSPRSGVESQQ